MSVQNRKRTIALPIVLALAASGCATKSYVRKHIDPVNQKVNTLADQTQALSNRQKADVSKINERIASTELRVSEVSAIAQQAQGTAVRAMNEAQSNKAKIAATNTAMNNAIDTLTSNVASSLNFQAVRNEDVMFGFNQSTLSPQAMSTLDQVAVTYHAQPRGVIELTGFTDQVGGKSYNLTLSRKRAEAVQRYLVRKNIPPRNIFVVGLGKEPPPPELMADIASANIPSTRKGADRMARRVHIRLLGAGDLTQGAAGRTTEQ